VPGFDVSGKCLGPIDGALGICLLLETEATVPRFRCTYLANVGIFVRKSYSSQVEAVLPSSQDTPVITIGQSFILPKLHLLHWPKRAHFSRTTVLLPLDDFHWFHPIEASFTNDRMHSMYLKHEIVGQRLLLTHLVIVEARAPRKVLLRICSHVEF